MLVLVVLVLVIRAHGCEQQYVGQPLEAASAAPLAPRPPRSDRWTASEAPGCRRASDRCLMAALCFVKISEFGTRGEPKHAFGRADWRRERKQKARATHVRLIFIVI